MAQDVGSSSECTWHCARCFTQIEFDPSKESRFPTGKQKQGCLLVEYDRFGKLWLVSDLTEEVAPKITAITKVAMTQFCFDCDKTQIVLFRSFDGISKYNEIIVRNSPKFAKFVRTYTNVCEICDIGLGKYTNGVLSIVAQPETKGWGVNMSKRIELPSYLFDEASQHHSYTKYEPNIKETNANTETKNSKTKQCQSDNNNYNNQSKSKTKIKMNNNNSNSSNSSEASSDSSSSHSDDEMSTQGCHYTEKEALKLISFHHFFPMTAILLKDQNEHYTKHDIDKWMQGFPKRKPNSYRKLLSIIYPFTIVFNFIF